ncbi:hypothetical protein N7499_009431 [Penicillium canescens]|uniref:Mid2 domain-containing protein n=1 Tax=Penicillium canescens TaxID=5083 RepID=A0AAD6INI4_PENCN|nr:uncharacterized protein N7446_008547 [Penicillium canescens]KAJ6033162.1 hypothetical protein N7444_010933 [Penicillium canescens]KAJ6057650.1 hypothetical protein N7460_000924 [Penicillium canescens]KAJ6058964.1 hypothetical protein N7446_008547 [Penicillium canescens]KAJ6071417.1 hypothetical protein N7499_009431 [Penicillium canescens]KAJ6170095.1 hypothetical protein N7485_007441 [Penicillium canescens]
MLMLPLYALSLLPLATAWTFLYTNKTDSTLILRGSDDQNCTAISLAKDKLFTFDPEGSDLCVSIYYDDQCSSRAGYSCTSWRKNASASFFGVDIAPERPAVSTSTTALPSSSTAASTSASTSTSTSASVSESATSTPTSTPTPSDAATSDTSSGLSGGAIAGIVIGVVAGLAVLAGLIFFFMRRNRKKNAPASVQPGSFGHHEAEATVSSLSGATEKPPGSSGGGSFRPAPGSKLVELAGDAGTFELPNSPLSEMDGHSATKPSYRV